jgi:hypothetical protein
VDVDAAEEEAAAKMEAGVLPALALAFPWG